MLGHDESKELHVVELAFQQHMFCLFVPQEKLHAWPGHVVQAFAALASLELSLHSMLVLWHDVPHG